MSRKEVITIKSLRIRPVLVPMETPHQTASGTIVESPLILIDITTNNGIMGNSIIFTYTPAALVPVSKLIENLEPLIIGKSLAPKDIFQQLNEKFRLLGTQGFVGMAIAGIDMALWDALAKESNMPLTNLLGVENKKIPAYGAVGYDGAKKSADVAYYWAKQGFKGVKAKIGYPSVKEDIEVIKAMRSAVGDDISIMVDYNQSLSPTEAIKRARLLDKENLAWIEEPTLAHDYEGHAQVVKEAKTPIQCGENWWGVLDMQHAINTKASDYMMIDAMKIGGVTGWLKASSLAYSNNIEISSHLWTEISARLLSCTPTANWLEYCDWWNPVIQNPLIIKDGYTQIDNSIGSGIQWNEKAIKDLLI